MRTRQRPPSPQNDERARPAAGTSGAGDAGAARRRAERLLDAAEDAIARALSDDSEQFLAENRQQGGQ